MKKFLPALVNAGLTAVGVFDDLRNLYEGTGMTKAQFFVTRPYTKNTVESVRHYLSKNELFTKPTRESLLLMARDLEAVNGPMPIASNGMSFPEAVHVLNRALHEGVLDWMVGIETSLAQGDKSLVSQYRHAFAVVKRLQEAIATLDTAPVDEPKPGDVSVVTEDDIEKLRSHFASGNHAIVSGTFESPPEDTARQTRDTWSDKKKD